MPDEDRMKIAFVYDVIYPYVKGGVEKRVWELATRLAKRGHEVHIFGMKYWEGDAVIRKDGVILHGVCPGSSLYTKRRRGFIEPLRFSCALLPHLLANRFDIIDCQQFPFFPALAARLATTIRKMPLVVTWHEVWGDYWYEYLGRKGIVGKVTETVVSRVTRNTVAVSGTTAEQLRKLRPGIKPVLIPNGIDIAGIAATQPSNVSSDIIFAGRLIREKHADLLVEAIGLLVPDAPQLTAIIIGEGPERDHIQNLIRSQGLEDRITLRGFFADHRELIAHCKSSKVFVLPSTREGFGITALEALASGLPVVTVDHPANAVRELVDEKTGFVCALTAEDLAGTIRSALQKYSAMREACIVAARRYDWDLITAKSEEYYRSVIAKTGSAQENLS
jgi:glycosyltransferase involved in cell wall biosynthesis